MTLNRQSEFQNKKYGHHNYVAAVNSVTLLEFLKTFSRNSS